MPIPITVSYTTTGTGKHKKTTRNVIGVICPKAISYALGFNTKPLFVEMGDIKVDWDSRSPGFNMLPDEAVFKVFGV